MDRFSDVEFTFKRCLERARSLVEVQRFLSNNYSPALDTDDMLRASIVLGISAFDYLNHEIFRIESVDRFKRLRGIERFDLPFSILIADQNDREELLNQHIKEKNSHRSFVDPAKISEALGCFVTNPWDKIAQQTGTPASALKARVRTIYRWRNRIAHEADINPTFSGIEFWPIIPQDVTDALEDVENIGIAIVQTVRAS